MSAHRRRHRSVLASSSGPVAALRHDEFDAASDLVARELLLLHRRNSLWNSLRALKFDLRSFVRAVYCHQLGVADAVAKHNPRAWRLRLSKTFWNLLRLMLLCAPRRCFRVNYHKDWNT